MSDSNSNSSSQSGTISFGSVRHKSSSGSASDSNGGLPEVYDTVLGHLVVENRLDPSSGSSSVSSVSSSVSSGSSSSSGYRTESSGSKVVELLARFMPSSPPPGYGMPFDITQESQEGTSMTLQGDDMPVDISDDMLGESSGSKVILERFMSPPVTSMTQVDEPAAAGEELIEERLRKLGVISSSDGISEASFKDINLKISMPQKEMKAFVLSLGSDEAYKFLSDLVGMWKSKTCDAHHILPWINCVLVNHNHYIVSQESVTPILDSILEISRSRGSVIESLLQLSGRLQLVTSQVDIAAHNKSQPIARDHEINENEDDEDVEETLFNEEDESDTSSNDDDRDAE